MVDTRNMSSIFVPDKWQAYSSSIKENVMSEARSTSRGEEKYNGRFYSGMVGKT